MINAMTDFDILDGDVPRRASYGVNISQLIRFAGVCNHVADLTREVIVYQLNVFSSIIGIINFEKQCF